LSDLTDKIIVITGASRGIGEAAARYLATKGAKVVLAARSTEDIERIAGEITKTGGTAISQPCDVSDYAQVKVLMDTVVAAYGGIDVLVNNAGLIDPIARLIDSDPEKWGQIVDINYKGVYYCLHTAIPEMLRTGGGTIINISSGAATGALEGWSHYCSTKAAVLSLTQCAHKEHGDQGIRVVGLSPGTVATDMQVKIKNSGINPVSKLDFSVHIPPAWVAKAIAYLAGAGADKYAGSDFSLKNDAGRAEVGLPPG